MASESRSTVLVALGANLGIAAAKLVAGLLSGSSAMLAEAAHSTADTVNQVFLLTALRRGDKASDAEHPFGYGKERFFWSLLAAVGIFVAGGVFSMYEGVHGLLAPAEDEPSYLVSYAVLGVALVLEGASLAKAYRQTRREADRQGKTVAQHVKRTPDPTLKTVLSEDAAAVVGLLLAGAGLGLHQLTGSAAWDSAAAVAIGVVLVVVAFVLGRDTKDLLIGQAADPETRVALYDDLQARPEVERIVDLMTMLLGPDRLLVAVRADLAADLDSSAVEDFASRVERELMERHERVAVVLLDPTTAVGEDADRADRLRRQTDLLRSA
ncbi:MAG: cation diffusion facilitator family transporter [Frankiales bacterium]|nr:cation diffusion facilitator family transporter [Frankiales bacterium]